MSHFTLPSPFGVEANVRQMSPQQIRQWVGILRTHIENNHTDRRRAQSAIDKLDQIADVLSDLYAEGVR